MHKTGKGVFGYISSGLKGELHHIISYPISRIIKGISDCMELGKERMDNDGQCSKVGGFLCLFFDQHALLILTNKNGVPF